MAPITSCAWNARYTDNHFKKVECDYGKLAGNFPELVARIYNVADKLSDTKSNVSEILIMLDKDDERGNLCYVPITLVKSIMNIHYSMLKFKSLIELYVSEREAKFLYNRLREKLALKKTLYPNKKGTRYTWHGRNESVALAKQLERFHALHMPSTTSVYFKGDTGKKGFSFNEAQAFYNGKELKLPSGEVQEQFRKLADKLGQVVLYKDLDSNYTSATPGRLPQNILIMRKALKSSKVPFVIKTYTYKGYCLKNRTS